MFVQVLETSHMIVEQVGRIAVYDPSGRYVCNLLEFEGRGSRIRGYTQCMCDICIGHHKHLGYNILGSSGDLVLENFYYTCIESVESQCVFHNRSCRSNKCVEPDFA